MGVGHGAAAVVYLGFLIYLFLGVAIVADLFMASIEVITSKTKTLTVRHNTNLRVASVYHTAACRVALLIRCCRGMLASASSR